MFCAKKLVTALFAKTGDNKSAVSVHAVSLFVKVPFRNHTWHSI